MQCALIIFCHQGAEELQKQAGRRSTDVTNQPKSPLILLPLFTEIQSLLHYLSHTKNHKCASICLFTFLSSILSYFYSLFFSNI